MNLFILDRDPEIAASMACDKHVVKMPIETAQMLSTVMAQSGLNIGYKPTHVKHPCTKWVGASSKNFHWALEHGLALCREYTYRYLHIHAVKKTLVAIKECSFLLRFSEIELTPFVQALPEEYKREDPVEGYREFYRRDKARFAKWTSPSKVPDWFRI